jgi:hypothetical protein
MDITDTMTTTADQSALLQRVQEATADHARTRLALDTAIADATDAGVPPEALQTVGQLEPGHGRHAADLADIEVARLEEALD